MAAIFKREFRSYMRNVTGPLFIAFMLLVEGFFCWMMNILMGYGEFYVSLNYPSLLLMITIPVLAMRSIAEERHAKTDQLLYSLPMSLSRVVLGKYFAMLAIWAITCGIIAVYPAILSGIGMTALLPAYCSLLAFFLLGAALLALSMFLSALTESQIIAAVLSVAGALALYLLDLLASAIPDGAGLSFGGIAALLVLLTLLVYFLTKNLRITLAVGILTCLPTVVVFLAKPAVFDGLLSEFLSGLSLYSRMNAFYTNIFSVGTIVYDISFIVFFLFLTWQAMEKKRWS